MILQAHGSSQNVSDHPGCTIITWQDHVIRKLASKVMRTKFARSCIRCNVFGLWVSGHVAVRLGQLNEAILLLTERDVIAGIYCPQPFPY